MKGQVNFEFILSVVVFISIMSFITLQIINSVSSMRSELEVEDMKSSAYQISNLVMFDMGWPDNWNPDNVQRLGLSSGFYSLDASKVSSLSQICESEGGYRKFLSLIGLEISKDVYLNISTASGETVVLCSPSVESQIRARVETVRTSSMDGDIVKVVVRVVQ